MRMMIQTMGSKPTTLQVSLSDVKKVLGDKTWRAALAVSKTLNDYFNKQDKFTGKIIFTINCREGGVGNIEAFVQKKI